MLIGCSDERRPRAVAPGQVRRRSDGSPSVENGCAESGAWAWVKSSIEAGSGSTGFKTRWSVGQFPASLGAELNERADGLGGGALGSCLEVSAKELAIDWYMAVWSSASTADVQPACYGLPRFAGVSVVGAGAYPTPHGVGAAPLGGYRGVVDPTIIPPLSADRTRRFTAPIRRASVRGVAIGAPTRVQVG